MDRLRDKVALVTGGGGSIGAATARLFADEGAKVVLADVDEDALAAATDEIGADRAAYVVTDVTDSEHAIVGLMRTAASEVAGRGIRVNSLHPGPVDNGFQHGIEVRATGASEARAAELFEERIPLGRHARPEEIARSVLFLASDDSSFVTATTLTVDGGVKG